MSREDRIDQAVRATFWGLYPESLCNAALFDRVLRERLRRGYVFLSEYTAISVQWARMREDDRRAQTQRVAIGGSTSAGLPGITPCDFKILPF